MRRIAAVAGQEMKGVRSGSLHTVKPILPPGLRTRLASRMAPDTLGKNITPKEQTIRSKLASGKSSCSASITRVETFDSPRAAASFSASRSIPGEMSTMVTLPSLPMCSASLRPAAPVPPARSRADSPLCGNIKAKKWFAKTSATES